MALKQNVGKVDKWIRIVIGTIIAITGYYLQNTLLGVAGVIIFITGTVNRCLIYDVFGISTCTTPCDSKKDTEGDSRESSQ